MSSPLSLPIQSVLNQKLLSKNWILIIFGFFNALALIQFSTLQLRPFLTNTTNDRAFWSLITLLISYNVWAFFGAMFLRVSRKRQISNIEYLLFFISASLAYNLTSALIYQMSLGFPLELNRIGRSFILNATGLIHLNILFMLSLLGIKNWFDRTQQETEKRESIALRTGPCLEYIYIDEVVMVRAEQNYVSIQLKGGGQPKLFRYKISELEKKLSTKKGFMRIHRSHIINLSYLTGLSTAENGTDMSCHLNNTFTLPVSRLKKQELKNIVDTLHR